MIHPSDARSARADSQFVHFRSWSSVERLFTFVLRSRILIVGRDTLARSKGRLHFVLITHDLSEGSRSEILSEFPDYPIMQHYTQDQLEEFFGARETKL
jgi:hypothetical protein